MAGNEMVAERTTTSGARSEHLARAARDTVLLVARVGLGVLMVWHAKIEYDFGGSVSGVIATARTGSGPRVMAALRNLAVGAIHLIGRRDITETTRWATRFMDRPFKILNLM